MSNLFSGDQVGAIVVDVGSAATKIGWAGDDYPKSYFRSNVAVQRNDSTHKIESVKYDFFSKPIESKSDGNWDVYNPINPATGLLYDVNSRNDTDSPDWYECLQFFIEHAYSSALGNNQPEDHPLILAEKPYNAPAIRQASLECLFETLQAPAVFMAKDSVLSCYGCGRTSATVVDVGYSGTTVAPVFDGFCSSSTVLRNPGASLFQVDNCILETLDKLYAKKKRQKNVKTVECLYQTLGHKQRKESIHAAARLHLASECRLAGAGVSINTAGANFHAPSVAFELPDRTVVDLPSTERFAAANLLYGKDSKHENVLEATQNTIRSYMQETTEEMDEDQSKALSNEAAGIVSRRATKRGTTKKASLSSTRKSNVELQRACQPHLETINEQLLTASPVASMACDAVYKCDREQQATLLSNVILCGGGACLGPTDVAAPDLVKESIEALIHQHTPNWRVKLLTPSVSERAVLPWIGGSILGSLGTFHEMYISKAEYEEWGSAIVNRKCP